MEQDSTDMFSDPVNIFAKTFYNNNSLQILFKGSPTYNRLQKSKFLQVAGCGAPFEKDLFISVVTIYSSRFNGGNQPFETVQLFL